MGCAMQQGTMVMNVTRKGAIRAGLPVPVCRHHHRSPHAPPACRRSPGCRRRSVMLDGVDDRDRLAASSRIRPGVRTSTHEQVLTPSTTS
jgi:hypothetical protein